MKRFLVVRRDNIGDLLCTTPFISNLRASYPDAEIDVLVNSYNYDAIKNNPDVNHIYVYEKAKHVSGVRAKLLTYVNRIKMMIALKAKHYDYAFLCSPGERTIRLAKQAGVKNLAGFYRSEQEKSQLTYPVSLSECAGKHEAERVNLLLSAVATQPVVPPMTLKVEASVENIVLTELQQLGLSKSDEVIGVHVSARKPSNRWTTEKYISLIQALLSEAPQRKVLLFWSPGSASNKTHPGDDEKAKEIVERVNSSALIAYKTSNLQQLIAMTQRVDLFVCSDGGAMHVAAGLHKKVLCFFGDSDISQWYPWGVSHRLMTNESKDVSTISVASVLAMFEELYHDKV